MPGRQEAAVGTACMHAAHISLAGAMRAARVKSGALAGRQVGAGRV